MSGKPCSIGLLAGIGAAVLLAAGCASDETPNRPYSLTGATPQQQMAAYTDQKGHYRPAIAEGVLPAPGYPQPTGP